MSTLRFGLMFFVALLAGCVRPQVGNRLPLCGVLTERGASEPTFLVPEALDKTAVRRYRVEPNPNILPPLEVSAGWWVCVTEGEILEQPKSASPEVYGRLRIEALEADQSNLERGQE